MDSLKNARSTFHFELSNACKNVTTNAQSYSKLENTLYDVASHLKVFKAQHLLVLSQDHPQDVIDDLKDDFYRAMDQYYDFHDIAFETLEQGVSETELSLISEVLLTIKCDSDFLPDNESVKDLTESPDPIQTPLENSLDDLLPPSAYTQGMNILTWSNKVLLKTCGPHTLTDSLGLGFPPDCYK